MSLYVSISSVCGDITTKIDSYDYDLNPHGVICCGNCRLIIATRESWAKEYGYEYV